MRAQLSNRDYEQLSAYIDGQLAPHERLKLEENLHVRPELQAALDEMSRTRMLLRQAPRRRAPRNFTLTPAMVGDLPRRRRGNWLNMFPALSFASALATLALVVSIVFELLPGQMARTSQAPQPQFDRSAQNQTLTATNAPAAAAGANPAEVPPAAKAAPAATQAAALSQAAPAESAPSAPPVIVWGQPGYGSANATGLGGGAGGGGQGPSLGPLLGPPTNQTAPLGMGGGPTGQFAIPTQGVNSLDSAPNSAQAQAAPAQPAQPNAAITGTGPILGVAKPGQGGQIVEEKSIQGQPGPVSPPQPEIARSTVSQTTQQQDRFGLSNLVLIQVLLGLIALATGLAAFLIWRRMRA